MRQVVELQGVLLKDGKAALELTEGAHQVSGVTKSFLRDSVLYSPS